MEGRWQQVTAQCRNGGTSIFSAGGPDRFRVTYFDKYFLYHGDFNDHYADLEATVRFRVEGDALFWILCFRNLSDQPLTIGDIGLPLPFNTGPRWDKVEMYTERQIPHPLFRERLCSFIG
jgi:hypothetical protein